MYEWDAAKAAANLRKHGVDFADAIGVLNDPLALTLADHSSGEERSVTLGIDPLGRVLLVVCVWRGDRIRVISARKVTPREREEYWKEQL